MIVLQSQKTNVPSTWEETKDLIEERLDRYIWVRDNVAPVIQLASSWWIRQNEPYEMQVARRTMDLLAKNSVIANTVTAISMDINKAAKTIAEKWQVSPVGQWYEKNKIAINTTIGTVAIGGLAVVAAIAGPAALGISAVGVLAVGGIAGTVGAGAGAFNGLVSYYEENGTIDGSTQTVLEEASVGFRNATVGVATTILTSAAFKHLKNTIKSFKLTSGTSTLAQYGDDFGKMGTYVENPNIKVDWTQYAEHAAERMKQRGMTQEMIDNIVKNGKVLSQNNGNKFAYISQEGAAIVSKEGKLITAWSSAEFDSNMIETVSKLFGE